VALLAAAALVPVACGGDGTAGVGGQGQAAVARVVVEETEFTIALSEQGLEPGAYTFVVENIGSAEHALEIEGPGLGETATETIAPGQSAKLAVTLEDGTYRLYCLIDGHRERGMALVLAVGNGGYGGS
jgi:uncharacterized cupredoxin-like copper-binding protein